MEAASPHLQQALEAGKPGEAAEPPKDEGADNKEKAEGKEAAEGDQAKDAEDKERQSAEAKKDEGGKVFTDPPQHAPVAEEEPVVAAALEQVQVLRHLPEGRSPNFSSLRHLIIVPLGKEKAEETLKEGRVIGDSDVEALQKEVEGLSK